MISQSRTIADEEKGGAEVELTLKSIVDGQLAYERSEPAYERSEPRRGPTVEYCTSTGDLLAHDQPS